MILIIQTISPIGKNTCNNCILVLLTFLSLISCNESDVSCNITGPAEGISIYLPLNGEVVNSSCSQNIPNKAVLANGVTLTTDRNNVPNAAYLFNGINGIIYAEDVNYTSELTVSCWVKPDNLSQNAVIMYYGNPNLDGYGLIMSNGRCGSGNKVALLIGSISCDITDNSELFTDTSWKHLALVKRNNSFTLFVNGNQRLTVNNPYKEPTKRFSIGANIFPADNNGYFTGKVDEVRVYDRALTLEEIIKLYSL